MVTVNHSRIPSNLVKSQGKESFEGHEGVINYVDYKDPQDLDQTSTTLISSKVPALKDQEALKKLFKDNGLVSLPPLVDRVLGKKAERYLEVVDDNEGGKLITVLGSPNVEGFTDRIWPLAWSKIKPSDHLMSHIQQGLNNGFKQADQLIGRLLGTGNSVLNKVFVLALQVISKKQSES
jgi:hypothetical protein